MCGHKLATNYAGLKVSASDARHVVYPTHRRPPPHLSMLHWDQRNST